MKLAVGQNGSLPLLGAANSPYACDNGMDKKAVWEEPLWKSVFYDIF